MKSLRFVFQYTHKYAGVLSLTILSMLLLVGVQLYAPWLVKSMIEIATDSAGGQDDLGRITQLALLALILYAARAVLQFFRSYLAHVAGWNVVADVRSTVYQHLQRLSLRYYEDKQTGQLMSLVVNDADLIEQLSAHAVPDGIANSLMLVGVIAV